MANTNFQSRSPSAIELIAAPFLAIGEDEAAVAVAKLALKQRIAFYASTRTYHPVFAVHGWSELGMRLHALSREGRWDEMTKLIPDEMAAAFATIAPLDELGDALREKWGGLVTTLNLPTDLPLGTEEERRCVRRLVETLQRA